MADPVTYTATLPISRPTVERIAVLLHEHRRALRTRSRRRSLGCFTQAVLFCRWMLHATRVRQLAADHHLSLSTAYRYLAEVLDVLAEQAPGLRGALLAAKIAGYPYVMLDGTLIPTDRCSAPSTTRPHPGRRPVVVGQAPQTRREHPGDHRPWWVADMGLTGASRSLA